MDGELARAITSSYLRDVPEDLRDRLFDAAVDDVVAAGTITHRQGDPARHCEFVVRGVFRVYVSAPDGRTMTIRYCRPGGLLGVMSLYRPDFAMPATIQSLVEARLLRLSPAVVTDLVGHRAVAEALLRELAARANLFLDEIAGNAFATVRQRVARHLLDLSGWSATGAPPEHRDSRSCTSASRNSRKLRALCGRLWCAHSTTCGTTTWWTRSRDDRAARPRTTGRRGGVEPEFLTGAPWLRHWWHIAIGRIPWT